MSSVVRVRPPSVPQVWRLRPRHDLPFPLGDPGCCLFAGVHHALSDGLRRLGLRSGDAVLVPAYHARTQVRALRSAGIACRRYACGPLLAPSEDELDALLDEQVRALSITHYLGFPQDAARWRSWCDRHGLLLMEDVVHGWLGRDVDGRALGSCGHLAIFGLGATLGLPDGALLRVGVTAAAAGGRPAAPDGYTGRASLITRMLLPHTADPSVAAARRAHYLLLLEELRGLVPPPFTAVPDGCSPFVFPIQIGEEDADVPERLRRHRVEAVELWPPSDVRLGERRRLAAVSPEGRTLGLPVHQALQPRDVERIVTAVRDRPAPRSEPRLRPIVNLEAARADWTKLAADAGHPFATWEWTDAWWRHFGGGRSPFMTLCSREDGRPVGIIPLYLSTERPVRVLRFIGHGPGDWLGPVCAPSQRAAVARALRQAVAAPKPQWDVLLGERLPAQDGWGALLGASAMQRESSPSVRIDGRTWDELLAARSANFRQQVRRRERRLRDAYSVRFRLADDPDRLAADFSTLVALHTARWGPSVSDAFAGARYAFHQEFAARALRAGWLRLWLLELDGRPVAAWHGFRYGGADWFYQSGRDPRCNALAVGFVLMAHALREAVRDGMGRFHLLRGAESYKARFADDDGGLETVALGRGGVGHLALGGATAALVLPPARREWLTRLTGAL